MPSFFTKKHTSLPVSAPWFLLAVLNLVLLVVVGALGYFIFDKSRSTTALVVELQTLAAQEEQANALLEVVSRTQENREKLANYFISDENIVDFVEQIESLAERAGVAVEFSTVSEREQENIPSLDVHFQTSGSFRDTYYFLTLLEALPFRLSFKLVSLERGQKEDPNAEPSWSGRFRTTLLSFSRG